MYKVEEVASMINMKGEAKIKFFLYICFKVSESFKNDPITFKTFC